MTAVYTVRFTIDVEAEDAIHAAEIACAQISDSQTCEVMSDETGKITVVRIEK